MGWEMQRLDLKVLVMKLANGVFPEWDLPQDSRHEVTIIFGILRVLHLRQTLVVVLKVAFEGALPLETSISHDDCPLRTDQR